MDERTLCSYVTEVVHQTRMTAIAAHQINITIERGDILAAFAACQSLLSAAALISKLMYTSSSKLNADGTPMDEEALRKRQISIDRARALRKALGIKQTILESRRVRNAIEHFDSRLDEFFDGSPFPIVDLNMGPKEYFISGLPGGTTKFLRHIDPTVPSISILNEEINIQELCDAVKLVQERAEQWLGERSFSIPPPWRPIDQSAT